MLSSLAIASLRKTTERIGRTRKNLDFPSSIYDGLATNGRSNTHGWRSLSQQMEKSTACQPEFVIDKARKISAPIGILAGLFGSLVGVGGGVVISPALVNACPTIPQRLVSGTSLAAVISTAVVSASTFSNSGYVDVAAAVLIAPAAMVAAPMGAKMTSKMNCAALRRALGMFLMVVAPLVPLKAAILSARANSKDQSVSNQRQVNFTKESFTLSSLKDQIYSIGIPTSVGLVTTGCLAGYASGLLGVGGGTVITPLLAITQPYNQATVLGTSLMAMIAPSIVALFQHARMGNVDMRMALVLSAGTALGSAAGSAMAVNAPNGVLEVIFAVGMLFLGRKTLQSAKSK